VSTSNGEPLGRVLKARLDQLECRLDGLALGRGGTGVARLPGADGATPLWPPPRCVMTTETAGGPYLTVADGPGACGSPPDPPKNHLHVAVQGNRPARSADGQVPQVPSRGRCGVAGRAGGRTPKRARKTVTARV
jgi:hypothetical protein